ncbi:MAG: twin-arginine translocation pathway signal protein [Pseudomonadota bacterium]
MPTLSRRKTLALIGGGTILAATASAGTFLTTRTPHAALAPWEAAGGYDDPRLDALSYALLAPNPHNRQPWEAELVGDDGIMLWRDKTRDLPVTDPFGRQLTIGMGCFLELCRMAAAERGFAMETVLFPDGEDGPVARLTLVDGGEPDPLFAHVMARRSHKDAFEGRAVGAEAAALAEHATSYLEGPDRDALRDHALDAWLAEAATPEAWQESVDLLRIGKAEIEAQPDGIDLGGPMMESLALAGIFTREAAADPDNPGTRDAIESTAFAIAHAPAITLTITPGNTRPDQIEAGRRWLRLNLAATGAGLALRPVSQALQEYEAVLPIREAVHARFAPDGGTVQMLGLLGYGERTPRTPRWPLETRLRHA